MGLKGLHAPDDIDICCNVRDFFCREAHTESVRAYRRPKDFCAGLGKRHRGRNTGRTGRRLRNVRPKADTFGVFEAALKDSSIEETPAFVGGGCPGGWAKAVDVVGIGKDKTI